MAEATASLPVKEDLASAHSRLRILCELAIAYALIMVVIWTPRPWQKLLWWFAAAAIVIFVGLSFNGLKPMGLRTANFFQSLWITGTAMFLAAIAVVVAVYLHTLRLPEGGVFAFVKTYWAYALWACFQQLLLQGFFLPRILGLTKGDRSAALLAAGLFALAHLPNPILTPVTLIWGYAACMLFLRYRNLYPLAMAHAIFGIAIAITIPGPVSHNMRVGLGYLTYGHHIHNPNRSSPPQLSKP